jgi:long-subunit acyl-CoA synthetase (AMP-forming)
MARVNRVASFNSFNPIRLSRRASVDRLKHRPRYESRAPVREIVDRVNGRLSSTEAVRRFAILDHDLSVEAGEVTPTLKIRRKAVSERYGSILENLYRT